jgi:hypothetical protein
MLGGAFADDMAVKSIEHVGATNYANLKIRIIVPSC